MKDTNFVGKIFFLLFLILTFEASAEIAFEDGFSRKSAFLEQEKKEKEFQDFRESGRDEYLKSLKRVESEWTKSRQEYFEQKKKEVRPELIERRRAYRPYLDLLAQNAINQEKIRLDYIREHSKMRASDLDENKELGLNISESQRVPLKFRYQVLGKSPDEGSGKNSGSSQPRFSPQPSMNYPSYDDSQIEEALPPPSPDYMDPAVPGGGGIEPYDPDDGLD